MITVKVGNNMNRKAVVVDPANTTVKDLFLNADIEIASASLSVNGDPIPGAQWGHTLEELGAREDDMFIAVIKTNNA